MHESEQWKHVIRTKHIVAYIENTKIDPHLWDGSMLFSMAWKEYRLPSQEGSQQIGWTKKKEKKITCNFLKN